MSILPESNSLSTINDINLSLLLFELEKANGKESFYDFVKMCWHVVNEEPFHDGIHVKAICQYLQACYEGKIRNLVMNIPLRHSKSIITNVFFPAWVWANKPSKKFLFASYGEALTVRDSISCRNLIKSEFYQARWPLEMCKDQDTKTLFRNMKAGFRACFGTRSAVTGQGGDFLIVDDPLDADQAHSEAVREGVNEWYDNSFSNRVANPKTVVRIIIMQRLHESDLTGHVLSKSNDWEHLVLPAEYEGVRFTSSIGFKDPRQMGEALWPERYPTEQLEIQFKSKMSELAVAGQLQQRPTLVQGNIFKKEWFTNRIENTDIVSRWISVDTAQSVKANADFNSIVVGELRSDYRLFIRHVSRKKLEFPDLQKEVEEIAERYKYNLEKIIIESKSSGISLQQSIMRTSPEWMKDKIVPWTPIGDKITRFYQSAVWCEKGCVLLPPHNEHSPWLFEFEEELFKVPNTAHDDQADALSQLIIFVELLLEQGLTDRLKKEGR